MITEYELEYLERRANEALYQVDPAFARELGYVPPPPPDPEMQRRMTVMLREVMQQQRVPTINRQMMQGQGWPQQIGQQGIGAAFGGIGNTLGGALGGLFRS